MTPPMEQPAPHSEPVSPTRLLSDLRALLRAHGAETNPWRGVERVLPWREDEDRSDRADRGGAGGIRIGHPDGV